jgi:hypothetical protein
MFTCCEIWRRRPGYEVVTTIDASGDGKGDAAQLPDRLLARETRCQVVQERPTLVELSPSYNITERCSRNGEIRLRPMVSEGRGHIEAWRRTLVRHPESAVELTEKIANSVLGSGHRMSYN